MGQIHNQISFVGQPPVMDFALVKLNGGTPNLVDMHTGAIYGLGPGEIVQLTTDIGATLKETLKANLDNMMPTDSVRVQIIVHSNSGIMFLPPNAQPRGGFQNNAGFVLTGEQGLGKQNIINAIPKHDGLNQENPPREIIVVGPAEGYVFNGLVDTNIKHATTFDNEPGNDDKEVMEAH